MISNPSDQILLARLQLLAQSQQYDAIDRITTRWLEANPAGNGTPSELPSTPLPPELKERPNDDTDG
jgi:hypothetical protein